MDNVSFPAGSLGTQDVQCWLTSVPVASSRRPRRTVAMAPDARYSQRPRTRWNADNSGARAVRTGKHSGGRAYASTRRLVNGNAEVEFPRLQLKHDKLASAPDGLMPGASVAG